MSGLWDTGPTDAGGQLTRASLERAADAIHRRPMEPTRFLTSMGTIRRARYQAKQAEAAATYAELELLALPRWRFLRRRFLRRRIGRSSRNAQTLRQMFGWE